MKKARVHLSGSMMATLLVVLGVLMPGCTREASKARKLPYSIADIDGNVSLSTAQFVLTMEGVSYKGRSTGELSLSGPGHVVGAVGFGEAYRIAHSYKGEGVCDIAFCGRKARIVGSGAALLVDGTRYRLGRERLVFLFKPNGTMEVRKTQPRTVSDPQTPGPTDGSDNSGHEAQCPVVHPEDEGHVAERKKGGALAVGKYTVRVARCRIGELRVVADEDWLMAMRPFAAGRKEIS